MNSSQMMITIGAMVLLSAIIMRVNSSFLSTNDILLNSKFNVLAISLATSIVEEANSKAFDEATDSTSVSSTTDLTPTNNLGPESGETYETFDDFDDYHNFTRVDSTMPSAVFNVACAVNYIDTNNPDGSSANRTWHKRITVTITSQSMTDTVEMSSIYSYWFFR